jgi:RNA polymerase sigma-70 factor, ECF subfamily
VNLWVSELVWTGEMMAIGMAGDSGGLALAIGREPDSDGDAWLRSIGDRELDRAYRLAGFILGNAAEAEDATQDALARAWNRRSTLRSGGSGQAWFDRILVNACRDRLRGRRHGIRWVPIEGDAAASSDPFAAAIAEDAVLRGLDALDVEHRAVVVLRFWADLSLDAIAARLDIPLGTVKSRLHYALRDLRAAIEPREADR